MIFPVGVIISSLEGWRVGCEGDNLVRDKVWQALMEERRKEQERVGVEDLEGLEEPFLLRNPGSPEGARALGDAPELTTEDASPERVKSGSDFEYWESRKRVVGSSDTATCASSIKVSGG